MIDFKVRLVDGASHDVDSSVMAFEIAARSAMREGMKKAGARLLEPIMRVEVITPSEYTGGIIGDPDVASGAGSGSGAAGNAAAIDALVPLANMFGYINNLRSIRRGGRISRCSSIITKRSTNISEEIQAKYA